MYTENVGEKDKDRKWKVKHDTQGYNLQIKQENSLPRAKTVTDAHYLPDIYKAVRMPDSVFMISIIVETDTHA